MKLTIGLGKGGSGKSTTSIYLALALGQRGGRVLLIDADATNQSTADWRNNTENWPENVVVVSITQQLAKQVQQLAGDYDHVIIDTGPAHPEILTEALGVTGDLLVPVGPSAMELRQLAPTLELAAKVDMLRPVTIQVLLTKMRAKTKSARDARTFLTSRGWPVLDKTVPLREAYAASWAEAPEDLLDYVLVLAEMLGEQLPADVDPLDDEAEVTA